MLGSNIFFNNKHSLGIPTGSATGVGMTCVGRTDAGITPGLPKGMLKACWTGTDPFTVGTPMLQLGNMWKQWTGPKKYKRKISYRPCGNVSTSQSLHKQCPWVGI